MLGEGRQQLAVLKKKKNRKKAPGRASPVQHPPPSISWARGKKRQLFLLGQKARIWGVSGSPAYFILSNRAVASWDEWNPFYMAVPSAHSNILRFTVFLGLLSPLHRFFWVLWYPSKDSSMGKWNRTNCCRWRMAQGQGLDPGWGLNWAQLLALPQILCATLTTSLEFSFLLFAKIIKLFYLLRIWGAWRLEQWGNHAFNHSEMILDHGPY